MTRKKMAILRSFYFLKYESKETQQKERDQSNNKLSFYFLYTKETIKQKMLKQRNISFYV